MLRNIYIFQVVKYTTLDILIWVFKFNFDNEFFIFFWERDLISYHLNINKENFAIPFYWKGPYFTTDFKFLLHPYAKILSVYGLGLGHLTCCTMNSLRDALIPHLVCLKSHNFIIYLVDKALLFFWRFLSIICTFLLCIYFRIIQ